MQLEKDRIDAKAKELRKMADVDQIHRERPPSVPVTSMQRIRSDDTVMNYHNKPSGRHSVDPTSMRHTPVHNDPSSRKKREFKEAVSMHSSLPRQARREESMQGNPQPPPVPPHHPSYMRVSASMTKFDNREFYNRQKPAATRSKPMSAEKASRPADREARSRTLFYDDIAASRKGKPSREESPEPPSQNFYITQQQERHRGPPDPPVHRHSLHTDTPNRYTPNRRLTRADHEGKSPGEDYAERNRATFYRLLQTQSPNGFDNRVEKIEMSLPYNL
uniref:Uncharacterized protein n=1 Tax=Ciona savignyi TaxID=51511 RepID=H2ZFA3_CIOSA